MPRDYRLNRFRGQFAVVWYEDGRRHRSTLSTTDRAEAERKIKSLIAEDLARERPGIPTVGELWDLYTAENAERRVAYNMKYTWVALKETFATTPADAITVAQCNAYAEKRQAAGKSDGTTWTELGHVRTVLRWAVKRRLIEFAPDIPRPKKPPPRDRSLTRAEVAQLLSVVRMPHLRLFITLAVATAARASAILELTWDRVDFERGLIRLENPEAKGWRKGRAVVPMNKTARALLAEAKAGALTNHVIEWAGDQVRSVKRGLAVAAKRAGLPRVGPHDLRHTAAVWMAERGIAMEEIAQYLGHSDQRLTYRVYARYSPNHLRSAADALELYDVVTGSGEPTAGTDDEQK